MGRLNKYETHVKPHLAEITEWYNDLTERQIAKKLGVSATSFEAYKKEYPELKAALKSGKDTLIKELKDTLKKKAKGFQYEEKRTTVRRQNGEDVVTVETFSRYSPPDTGAIHLLLKNLDDAWRNDDAVTIKLKQQKADLEKEKAEADNW